MIHLLKALYSLETVLRGLVLIMRQALEEFVMESQRKLWRHPFVVLVLMLKVRRVWLKRTAIIAYPSDFAKWAKQFLQGLTPRMF